MFEERDDKGGLMHRRRFCASGDADNGLSEDRGDNGRKGGGRVWPPRPSLSGHRPAREAALLRPPAAALRSGTRRQSGAS